MCFQAKSIPFGPGGGALLRTARVQAFPSRACSQAEAVGSVLCSCTDPAGEGQGGQQPHAWVAVQRAGSFPFAMPGAAAGLDERCPTCAKQKQIPQREYRVPTALTCTAFCFCFCFTPARKGSGRRAGGVESWAPLPWLQQGLCSSGWPQRFPGILQVFPRECPQPKGGWSVK